MSAIQKIAFYLNQRDEVPNQELARELVQNRDQAGVQEIAEHLWDKNKNIRSDCVKVLYEIGYLEPELIKIYTQDFLRLLGDKENRMVWGGMIALATVASRCTDEIWPKIDLVIKALETGTVITTVWGIRILAAVAASSEARSQTLFPILLYQIRTCIPRDVPTHAESMLCAVNAANQAEFLAVLESRRPEFSASQQTRLKKVVKGLK